MKHHLARALEIVLVPIAAAIVFFEQTLIVYLNRLTAAIASWPPIARLEAWLKRLPPYGALAAFVMPSILILPIKLAALWFAALKMFGLAIVSVIVGKMLATAILARLYAILRPTLMTIRWFAWADTQFFYWRDQAYAFVRSLPAWQKASALVKAARARLATLFSHLRRSAPRRRFQD